jgi:hypothetical protein
VAFVVDASLAELRIRLLIALGSKENRPRGVNHWPRLPDPVVDVDVFPSHRDDKLEVWNVGIDVVWFTILSARTGVSAPDHRAAGRNDKITSVRSGTDRNHGKENDNLGVDAAWINCRALSEKVRDGIAVVKDVRITVPAGCENKLRLRYSVSPT